MTKVHKKSTIKIDGEKLKELIEKAAGKNLYQISEENGFSKKFLSEAVRSGYASAVVQNVAKLYGINPDAYQEKREPESETKDGQMRIEDIPREPSISKDEIKAAIAEAVGEMLPSIMTGLTTALSETFEKACFKAVEDNMPYILSEYGKGLKGNIKQGVKAALTDFGWAQREVKK